MSRVTEIKPVTFIFSRNIMKLLTLIFDWYSWKNTGKWTTDETQNGWGVRVLDTTKGTTTNPYGNILSTINGTNVTNLTYTFVNCKSLIKGPEIPNTIVSLYGTFNFCESLVDAPNIPSNVEVMTGTFSGCSSLVEPPNMTGATGLRIINNAFDGCLVLKTFPDISNSTALNEMNYAFYGCTSLIDASNFIIPDTVIKISSLFEGCTSLKTAPGIPKNVKNMFQTFYGCSALTGKIYINSNVISSYTYCFRETSKSIVLVSNGENKALLDAIAKEFTNVTVTVE